MHDPYMMWQTTWLPIFNYFDTLVVFHLKKDDRSVIYLNDKILKNIQSKQPLVILSKPNSKHLCKSILS